ncbi:nuclease A inhibitor family protein, partial [Oscillochloris sp. ZM17-4]|uniref:nuclease A inhibitor family protein n=1 Tax=Oscillochloris sp. ZM17-4 TaxID=2866714 RepID=UPI001C73984F
HPWMSAAELEAADRFAALRAEVEARLTGAISCRAGRVRVRVLILGVSSRGLVVGLRTVAVES